MSRSYIAGEQEIRWEDTVMGERELMKFELKYIRGDTFYWGAAFDKALKAQAKISFEAGRKEVVEKEDKDGITKRTTARLRP